jgi:gamma-glutamylcyclotransferase (GGCT)/AIG2-like uncharacterized protein YtfP
MAPDVMAERAPDHRFLGQAKLEGYRLGFTRRSIRTHTGVADIVHSPGDTVWGALYEMSPAALRAIDRKEGHGWAYTRVPVTVRLPDGSLDHAETYSVLEKETATVLPSRTYLEGLVRAATRLGLPDAYVDSLARLPSEGRRAQR